MKDKKRSLVLISDRVSDYKDISIDNLKLEYANDRYFKNLYETMKSINPDVIHYSSPHDFLDNIKHHANSIVLSIWSGEKSENRRALVPSICEAYNIPYVGADAYLHIISSDKYLCKKMCDDYGIPSAKSIVLKSINCFDLLHCLKLPVVIKPNNEGGSIGILKNNLVDNIQNAKAVCTKMLKVFPTIIVEEYLPGYEVSVCITGLHGTIDLFEVMMQKISGNTYFTSEILSSEIKKHNKSTREIVPRNDLLSIEDKEKLSFLYNSFEKADVIRVDGRIYNNKFYLLELTPDCGLSIDGNMSNAFKNCGYSYKEMIEYLLNNAVKSWEYQNANK